MEEANKNKLRYAFLTNTYNLLIFSMLYYPPPSLRCRKSVEKFLRKNLVLLFYANIFAAECIIKSHNTKKSRNNDNV